MIVGVCAVILRCKPRAARKTHDVEWARGIKDKGRNAGWWQRKMSFVSVRRNPIRKAIGEKGKSCGVGGNEDR